MRKNKSKSVLIQLGKWLLPLAVLLALTGCWDSDEVNSLAIVTSAGIDRTKDGAIELILEIVAPQQQQQQSGTGQSSGQKGGKGTTIVRYAIGDTAADAQGRLQWKLPRTIYWGQLQVLVVGEALARDGLREQLDYLVRVNEIRLRVMPFVTQGKARDFFDSHFLLEQTKAGFLQSEAARVFHKPLTLGRLVQRLSSDDDAAVLPFINIPEDRGDKGGVPYIKGYAVFNQGRMVGTLTGNSFLATKWVTNQLKNHVETVNVGNESPARVTYTTLAAKSSLIPIRRNGEWQLNIRIESEINMIQNTSRLPMADPPNARLLEAAAAEHIREVVTQTVRDTQRMHADIFAFGEAIKRRNPHEWSRLEPQWNRFYPEMDFRVEASVKLRRIGMNSIPLGRQHKEHTKP